MATQLLFIGTTELLLVGGLALLLFGGKKEMPAKAKQIASLIGMAILFILMIIVSIKDVISLF